MAEPAEPRPKSLFSLRTVALARTKQVIAAAALGFSAGNCRKDGALDESGECLKRAESQQQGWREWWENRPDGLEQGFDIPERPLATAAGEPLQIQIKIEGASAKISDDGQSASFTTAMGQTLSYAQLSARDARNQALPIRLVAIAHGVALEVDDANAVYPIAVDPLIGSNWRGEQNQAGSQYAFSVAGVGDINADGFADVVVGAPRYTQFASAEGVTFLYLGGTSGLSLSAAPWGARGNQANSLFGQSVAAAGDVNADGVSDVIVGAPGFPSGGQVSVFYGHAGVNSLNPNPDWSFATTVASAQFGFSVAGAGDIDGNGYGDIIVGAPNYTGGGAAFVWIGSQAGFVANATLSGNQANAKFGFSVAGAGDVNGDGKSDVIVGAPSFSNPTTSVEGQAFVYLGSTAGISSSPIARPHGGQQGSLFGFSVAGAGDVNGDGFGDVLIGQPGWTNGSGQQQEGRVTLYRGAAGGLLNEAAPQWVSESDNGLAQLGYSVASAGDVNADGLADVIAGAPFYSASSPTAKDGRAFVWFGSSSTVIAAAPAVVKDGQPGSLYGASVSGAGDVNGDGRGDVLVGAPSFSNTPNNEGNAFLYYSNAIGGYASEFTSGTAWPSHSESSFATVGSVSSAGDINGDGFGDVLVIYPNNRIAGQPNIGIVKLFLGTANGPSVTPAVTIGGETNGGPPMVATSAGDVNGDGYGDVLIASPQYSTDTVFMKGIAHLYLGGTNGLTPTSWAPTGELQFSFFGISGASAGDVNGDGFGDVVIGAMGYDATQQNKMRGRIYVYTGNGQGLSTTAVIREIGVDNALFGASVASAGDVDRDGFSDIIVGAPGYTNVETQEGKAFIYKGGTGVLSASPLWQHESNNAGAGFGSSVDSAGDVNGDGYDDVIVGAPSYTNNGLSVGAAFVYHGGPNGPDPLMDNLHEFGVGDGYQFGASVAGAGDMNGDGYADVLIGEPGFNQGKGCVLGLPGSASGVVEVAAMLVVGPDGSQYGTTVANAGDINGDGYSDAMVRAPDYSTSTLESEGAAYVYLGNGNDSPTGLPIMPQARRTAAPQQPIVAGNKAFSTTSFDAFVLKARAPTGRTRVRLQVEVKPITQPFNGTTGLLTGAYTDTTTAGVTLKQTITTSSGGGATPHWRARLLYEPVRSLAPFGRSHWFYGGALGHSRGVHVRLLP